MTFHTLFYKGKNKMDKKKLAIWKFIPGEKLDNVDGMFICTLQEIEKILGKIYCIYKYGGEESYKDYSPNMEDFKFITDDINIIDLFITSVGYHICGLNIFNYIEEEEDFLNHNTVSILGKNI